MPTSGCRHRSRGVTYGTGTASGRQWGRTPIAASTSVRYSTDALDALQIKADGAGLDDWGGVVPRWRDLEERLTGMKERLDRAVSLDDRQDVGRRPRRSSSTPSRWHSTSRWYPTARTLRRERTPRPASTSSSPPKPGGNARRATRADPGSLGARPEAHARRRAGPRGRLCRCASRDSARADARQDDVRRGRLNDALAVAIGRNGVDGQQGFS